MAGQDDGELPPTAYVTSGSASSNSARISLPTPKNATGARSSPSSSTQAHGTAEDLRRLVAGRFTTNPKAPLTDLVSIPVLIGFFAGYVSCFCHR